MWLSSCLVIAAPQPTVSFVNYLSERREKPRLVEGSNFVKQFTVIYKYDEDVNDI